MIWTHLGGGDKALKSPLLYNAADSEFLASIGMIRHDIEAWIPSIEMGCTTY